MQPEILAKKIRNNLMSQKSKLQEYLVVLEKEESDYKEEDADKIIAHINLEKLIIDELFSLNKIFKPLEIMYNNLPYKKDNSLKDLKDSVNILTSNIKDKTKENKARLETIITRVKTDLKGIKKLAIANSSYSSIENNLVDISG